MTFKQLSTKIERINDLMAELQDMADTMVAELEEKRNAIEDKAIDNDRDMTDREQERYDKLDCMIDDLNAFMDELDEIDISFIEEYL